MTELERAIEAVECGLLPVNGEPNIRVKLCLLPTMIVTGFTFFVPAKDHP